MRAPCHVADVPAAAARSGVHDRSLVRRQLTITRPSEVVRPSSRRTSRSATHPEHGVYAGHRPAHVRALQAPPDDAPTSSGVRPAGTSSRSSRRATGESPSASFPVLSRPPKARRKRRVRTEPSAVRRPPSPSARQPRRADLRLPNRRLADTYQGFVVSPAASSSIGLVIGSQILIRSFVRVPAVRFPRHYSTTPRADFLHTPAIRHAIVLFCV